MYRPPHFLILALSLLLPFSSCSRKADLLPDAVDVDEIEPFDPDKLQLFYIMNLDQARSLLDNNVGILIIDVRSPEEFADGHIPGALNYNVQFEGFAEEIAAVERSTRVLLYDGGEIPSRTAAAAGIMKQAGFLHLTEMVGGFPAWKDAGHGYVCDLPTAMANP